MGCCTTFTPPGRARAAEAFARLGAARAEERALAALADAGPAREGILTRREVEILGLVGEGLSDKAIAERLTISEPTVHRHISNIHTKLGAPSRAAAVAPGRPSFCLLTKLRASRRSQRVSWRR